METDKTDLEETDSEEAFDFPPPERRILTQPYDLSVQTLIEQWESKSLIIPEIQREYMWDNGRASRLIESLILNIPIPPVYFAETEEAKFEIIDGHQRVESIVRYLNNQFALSSLGILSEYKGFRFHKLPLREQRFLKSRSLRAVVISHESHPNMKFEVFERLNTGGISLNAQELRNSIYRGSLNETLKQLARNEDFRKCIGTSKPRKRMVDEELVLRFLAMSDRLKDYKPPLKRFLNTYMAANRNASEIWLAERIDRFAATVSRVRAIVNGQAFRLIDALGDPVVDERGKPLPRGVNRALFDAQALAFSWARDVSEGRMAILQSISEVFSQPNFQDSVRRATGDKARLFLRIRLMVRALESAGLSLEVPFNLES